MNTISTKGGRLDGLALWILFSAWCTLLGWGLSLVGALNVPGYLVGLAVFGGGLALLGPSLGLWTNAPGSLRFRPRFLLPRIWLGLTLLIALGGLLHAPNNYDYLTYRFPRVLHWCWEQSWYWISTQNERQNYSGTGFEWLMAPLFILFQTDRLFFLPNLLSYLFLPGLVFAVFRQLGISPRVAWWWMWVLPCGFCYAVQAGSVGNDTFAAIYVLASLYYVMRKEGRPSADLLLSCLAIALATGAKASNLPLVLPWLIALILHRNRFLTPFRPGWWTTCALAAAAISFLPLAVLNIRETGDYSGDPTNQGGMKLTSPVTGILGNGLQFVVGNLAPPLSPKKIDFAPLIPASLKDRFKTGFSRVTLSIGEMQIEEVAGAGLGLTLFALTTVGVGGWRRFRHQGKPARGDPLAWWIIGGAVVATGVYMAKIGSESGPRLIAAYYPLLLAGVALVAALNGSGTRHRLFQTAGLLAMAMAFPLVVLNPSRPLFPVDAVGEQLARLQVPAPFLARYAQVYQVYSTRSAAFSGVLATVPSLERNLGLIANSNVSEGALWRPFGQRQVSVVKAGASRENLTVRDIRYVLVNETELQNRFHLTLPELCRDWSATVVAEQTLTLLAQVGPEKWAVVRL